MTELRKIILADGPFTIETMVEGNVVKEYFRGCRVGLSWPSPDNTGGYYCIVAQGDKKLIAGQIPMRMKLITGQYPLKVIAEEKGIGLNLLFDKLFNDMGIYGCIEICTDMATKYETFCRALDDYHRKKRPRQELRLKEAPYCTNFLHGVELIKKWMREIKGLDIPRESVIHSQLREIKESDLYGTESRKFFAIDGLRYVLGEFEVSDVPERRKNVVEKGISPRAWT